MVTFSQFKDIVINRISNPSETYMYRVTVICSTIPESFTTKDFIIVQVITIIIIFKSFKNNIFEIIKLTFHFRNEFWYIFFKNRDTNFSPVSFGSFFMMKERDNRRFFTLIDTIIVFHIIKNSNNIKTVIIFSFTKSGTSFICKGSFTTNTKPTNLFISCSFGTFKIYPINVFNPVRGHSYTIIDK